jgi:hypothetical protein
MKLFTKLLTATAVVIGIGFAGTATAGAAHPQKVIVQPGILPYPYPFPFPYPGPFPGPFPKPIPRVDFDYVVVYKPSVFAPAVVYGKFETFNGAQIAALRLQSLGVPTRIVPVRDYYNGWRW